LSSNHLSRKGCAVAAVLFFLGIAVSPSLTGSLLCASSEQDSYDVAIDVCGVKGYRPYTVSLPKQQYERLIRYLDGVRERMNAVSSQDTAVHFLDEAIAELHSYGVLPPGLTVPQTQLLIAGKTHHPRMFTQVESLVLSRWSKKHSQVSNTNLKNSFCALFAVATKIPGYSPEPIIIPFGLLLVLGALPALIASVFGQVELANQLAGLGVFLWMANPLRWFNFVVFEGYDVEFRSVGLKGLVHETLNTKGAFWGFTGLMLRPYNEKTYFLGFTFSIYGAN